MRAEDVYWELQSEMSMKNLLINNKAKLLNVTDQVTIQQTHSERQVCVISPIAMDTNGLQQNARNYIII